MSLWHAINRWDGHETNLSLWWEFLYWIGGLYIWLSPGPYGNPSLSRAVIGTMLDFALSNCFKPNTFNIIYVCVVCSLPHGSCTLRSSLLPTLPSSCHEGCSRNPLWPCWNPVAWKPWKIGQSRHTRKIMVHWGAHQRVSLIDFQLLHMYFLALKIGWQA